MIKVPKDKFILDACCGCRMMWFDKHHPNTIYVDIRQERKGFIKEKRNYELNPDYIMDFRKMAFKDKSFKLIFFDPPHLINVGADSVFKKQYGCLIPETWQSDLKRGFDECWRLLTDYGVLIFKWSDRDISLKSLLRIINKKPLVGNTSSGLGKVKTYWLTFMKTLGDFNG